jgi:hypothetical protein
MRNWIIAAAIIIVVILAFAYVRSLPSAQGQNTAGTASSASAASAAGSVMTGADPSRISTPG